MDTKIDKGVLPTNSISTRAILPNTTRIEVQRATPSSKVQRVKHRTQRLNRHEKIQQAPKAKIFKLIPKKN